MQVHIRPTLAQLNIERVPWRDLGPEFMTLWGRPGGRFDPEHVTVYGKSGGGKTRWVTHVMAERNRLRASHCVAVMTKRTDATIAALGPPWVQLEGRWPPGYAQTCCVYWARPKGISAAHRIPQRAKVRDFMDAIWVPNSNKVVYWDELSYIEKMLRLQAEIENFYREGRSNGITNIASMQRPAGVNRYAHSEPGWTVAFPPKDQDDRDRVAEVLGDRVRFRAALDELDRTRYEFLLRYDRTGDAYVSHLPPPPRKR